MNRLCLLVLLLFLSTSLLMGESLEIDGESYQLDTETNEHLYISPRVRFEGNTIVANQLRYSNKERVLHMEGSIIINSETVLLTADSAHLDLNTSRMTLQHATLFDAKNGLYIVADSMEKVAPDEIHVHGGRVSLCKPNAPSWELLAPEVVYYVDNFAYLTNAAILFHSVPIFYTPFLSWPTKNGRSTGILAPSFEIQFGNSDRSKNWGNRLQIPFFWALDRDQDVTLTADYLSKRGMGLDADYLYAFRPGMSGRLRFWYLDENDSDRILGDENMGSKGSDGVDLQPTRYRSIFDHRQNIFWGGQFFYNQLENSDNEVNKEYFKSTVDLDIHRSQTASFVFPLKNGGVSLRGSKRDDFLVSSIYDQQTDEKTHLNELPALSFSKAFLQPFGLPITLSLSSNATKYQRQEGWQGLYAVNEIEARSNFSVDFLNFTTSAKRSQFYYDVEYALASTESTNSGFDTRPQPFGWGVNQLRLESNLELFRLYQNEKQQSVGRLSFRPRIIFDWTDDVDQRQGLATTPAAYQMTGTDQDYSFGNHTEESNLYGTMFGNPLMARNSVTFRWETLYQVKNPLTFATRRFLELNLTQIYNLNRVDKNKTFVGPQILESFQETEPGDPVLPLRIQLKLAPTDRFNVGLFYRYGHQERKVIETRVGFGVQSVLGDRLTLDYVNNTKKYNELDGTNHDAVNYYSISNSFRLGQKVTLALTGSWDLGRNNLADQYSSNPSVERLDRRLTSMTGLLTFAEDCYRYNFGYSEKLYTYETNGVSKEAVERIATVSFTILGWPETASPYSAQVKR